MLYLNVAMMFDALYRLVAEISPGAFRGLAIEPSNPGFIAAITYFSLSALTTAGFGDIVPIHPFARCLANMEAIIGQLYPATLLARIVTLELAHRRGGGRRSDGQAWRTGGRLGDAAGDGNSTMRRRESDWASVTVPREQEE